ncbi:MAG: flagellar hook-length control protein FliK [Myxococcaceae bacterium]
MVVPKEEKKKTTAHPAQQPQQPVEQQLAKLEVEAPKPVAAAPSQPVTPVAAPVQAAAAPEVKAVFAALPPLPIDPALAQQDSLRVMLLPHAAKVSVETPDSGRLEVRVDVHDGVAHVRAAGEAAPLIDARTNELRVALAQEGLALGNFELGQQQRRPDDPERPSDASGFRRAQPAAKSATEGQKSLDGGLHIHA